MALGGLGAILLSGHPSLSPGHVLSKVDLRSVFFGLVFAIIVLVLAYLTNPSETSFRTYLTELSFKQHLSQLDESGQDSDSVSDDSGVHFSLLRRSAANARKSGNSFDPTSPFHFVSRASVSLRTPKHVFHSFGILTVAAVYPAGRPSSRGNSHHAIHTDNLSTAISDAWYVGAFGRWWRGGVIQSWWHEMLANAKDTERCGSGLLDVKALDSLEGFDCLPFPTPSRLPTDNTNKTRGTERSLQRSTSNAPRSTTPPPLPKSASLPLHAPKVVSTPPKANGHSPRHAPSPSQALPPMALEPSRPPVPQVLAYSPSSTSLWDSSPIIAEVLRQISQSKAAVHELRTQLTDFRAGAAEARESIQSELEAQRERKREDDGARAELKARTKTLEDSKRSAEGGKRDAEKRLRAAESARDSAAARIERLGKEIGALKGRMHDDEVAAESCKEEGDEKEKETQEMLERKKKEIKVAEDVVAALNARAKELEEKIAQEEERLRRAKEEAEIKKQDRSFFPLTVVPTVSEEDIAIPPWTSYPEGQGTAVHSQLTHDSVAAMDRQEPFPQPIQAPKSRSSQSSGSGSGDNRDVSVSPRPARLSLTAISNLREPSNRVLSDPDPNGQVLLRHAGFPLFGSELPSTLSTQSTSTRFSPFGDSDDALEQEVPADAPNSGNSLSPMSASYIPSSLINSLDAGHYDAVGLARSFQSEDDAVLSRDWRKSAPFPPPLPVENPTSGPGTGLYTSSPTSLTCPSFDGVDKDDPFEVRPPPPRRRFTGELGELQHPARTSSDPPHHPADEDKDKAALAHRRWASTQDAAHGSRLNPEAKAFSLTSKAFLPTHHQHAHHAHHAHHAQQPHHPSPYGAHANASLPSLASSLSSAHSALSLPDTADAPSLAAGAGAFSALSMRAFAPSPAEREALQRALGGSSNTSLERLPTLSEVSLPLSSSPAGVNAVAASVGGAMGGIGAPLGGGLGAGLGAIGGGRPLLPAQALAWLSLPRRKPKFSPWAEEDAENAAGARGL